jgi:chemotaxis protein CheX
MKTKVNYILIIEAVPSNRQYLRQVLKDAGFSSVVEASSAMEASLKMELQEFDIVVLNPNVPRIKEYSYSSNENLIEISFPFSKDEFIKTVKSKLVLGAEVITKAVDVNFINPFIEATLQVLRTTANTPATKEQVFLRKEDDLSGDISAIVAMNGNKFRGSMAISFDSGSFLSVVNGMLDEKFTAITEENSDAAGEICNQIFGVAKKVLNQDGHDIQPAVPSVVVGAGHKIKHQFSGPCIAVRFKTSQGFFTIEAILQPNTDSKAA